MSSPSEDNSQSLVVRKRTISNSSMDSVDAESIGANSAEAGSSGMPASAFLNKLPLELREMIYRMLLTTQFCTQVDRSGVGLEFNLETAILLANKQLSVEAKRVLHEENHFIIFKIKGFSGHPAEIPIFRYLSEDKVPNLLLRIELGLADERLLELGATRTQITTLDGLQSIIRAIWNLEKNAAFNHAIGEVYHGDLKVSLKFHFKDKHPRYEVMSNLALKPWLAPWERVSGFKKLELLGGIEMSKAQHLLTFTQQGFSPSQITENIEEYHSLAESKYSEGDYDFARFWWVMLDDYVHYLFRFKPHGRGGLKMLVPGTELWQALENSLPLFCEGKLGLGKIGLRQQKYEDVISLAEAVFHSPEWPLLNAFGYEITLLTKAKFHLCACLARAVLGEVVLGEIEEHGAGEEDLRAAASSLSQIDQYKDRSESDLLKDLESAINNELIEIGSLWRCGCTWKLWGEKGHGWGWEVREGVRSFWDWLDERERTSEQ
jgi:hypothetical protein